MIHVQNVRPEICAHDEAHCLPTPAMNTLRESTYWWSSVIVCWCGFLLNSGHDVGETKECGRRDQRARDAESKKENKGKRRKKRSGPAVKYVKAELRLVIIRPAKRMGKVRKPWPESEH